MSRYDGYVIEETAVDDIDLSRLEKRLPEAMPDHANLLVGRGTT